MSQALINWKRVAQFSSGDLSDRGQLQAIIGMFRDTTAQSIQDIEAHCQSGDRLALAKSIHRLRGSCLTLGADSMTDLLEKMEALAESQFTAGMPDLLAQMRTAFQSTADQFRAYLDGGDPG